jgi:hypothetical protein
MAAPAPDHLPCAMLLARPLGESKHGHKRQHPHPLCPRKRRQDHQGRPAQPTGVDKNARRERAGSREMLRAAILPPRQHSPASSIPHHDRGSCRPKEHHQQQPQDPTHCSTMSLESSMTRKMALTVCSPRARIALIRRTLAYSQTRSRNTCLIVVGRPIFSRPFSFRLREDSSAFLVLSSFSWRKPEQEFCQVTPAEMRGAYPLNPKI